MSDEKPVRERACYLQLMGAWAVDPGFLEKALATVKTVGIDAIVSKAEKSPPGKFNSGIFAVAKAAHADAGSEEDEAPAYAKTSEGTALMAIHGPISKRETSTMAMFGGTSSANIRESLAQAMADDSVKRIVLHIDSPGGTVSGTGDLADDIRAARSKKPILAYIEDLGASAAYWLAAQCSVIYASRHAEVGSIGVISAIYDESVAFDKAGIKPIVFRSSKIKGGVVAGEKPSEEMVAQYQRQVDATNAAFISSVAEGRGVSAKKAESWATAEMWFAPKAHELGLIDGIGAFSEVVVGFAKGATPGGLISASNGEKSAKSQIPPVGSTRNLRPTMPDESDLTTKVASLEASLQKETARAQAAEAKFTALKEANAALEAAIKGREATEAANAAIAAGKFPTEKREYLAAFYVKHGKEEFASLIEALPASTLGVSAGKAVAQAGFNTQGNEAVNRMAATVTANLTKGRVV